MKINIAQQIENTFEFIISIWTCCNGETINLLVLKDLYFSFVIWFQS